jgi:Putative prokaryotic signal transducing protein
MDEGVPVTTVSDEIEAEVVCGLLRSAGIECGHRVTEATDSPLEGIAADGPREVLVHESELEAAKAVLADAQQT